MTKKIISILVIIVTLFTITANVQAAEIKTELQVVEAASETKYLEEDRGFISKTIVESNPENGEVTIEVKLSNITKEVEDETTKTNENYEIFLVIDDSGSMLETIDDGRTRQEAVYTASEDLVTNLLENYNNIKIGVVKFAADASFSSGVLEDAKKMCDLTDNKESVLTAIRQDAELDGSTNLEAGLLVAEKSFESNSNSNKIMVVLSDGAPNYAVNEDSETTVEDATKNTLIRLSNSGINIISLLTEIEDTNVAEEIFGTPENPTVGKYYYIADSDIQKVISENIFADISEIVENPTINNIKIVDYFPSDITENFEFSYVGNPNMGSISEGIDPDTKTITWEIDTLETNQEATLQYKLKLKDMKNSALLNKVIATNEKIVLTYSDEQKNNNSEESTETGESNKEIKEVILDSSPKIKLVEIEQEIVDNTQANTRIPDTGENILYVGILTVFSIMIVVAAFKLKNMKDIN